MPVNNAAFLGFAGARDLSSPEDHIEVQPWTPATELPHSQAVGDMIELPTACGKHVVYYPAILVSEAMRGRFYAFWTSCECGTAYLIETEADGAHCKQAGSVEAISELFESVPGDDVMIHDPHGAFPCNASPDDRHSKLGTNSWLTCWVRPWTPVMRYGSATNGAQWSVSEVLRDWRLGRARSQVDLYVDELACPRW